MLYDPEGTRSALGETTNNIILSLPFATTIQTIRQHRSDASLTSAVLDIVGGSMLHLTPGIQRGIIAAGEGASMGWVFPGAVADSISNGFLFTHIFMQNPSWGSLLAFAAARIIPNFITHESASLIEHYGYRRTSRRI